jgi:hypothetical protein
MHVEARTSADWILPEDGSAAPAHATGETPVQLVPENALRGGAPVDILPAQNQAFWIEVYIDRKQPAGIYKGFLTVTDAGKSRAQLPVELQVYDFTLPDENALTVMAYFQPEQVLLYHGVDLSSAYHRFAHRHRVEFATEESPESFRNARSRFDGSAYSAAQGYEGPGAGVGDRMAPASFYGPPPAFERRDGAWRLSDEWVQLVAALPGARTFLYMLDEPHPEQYPELRRVAENVRSNPGPGRALPIFVTSRYTPELADVVDIWCSPPLEIDPARIASERSRGAETWFYNGMRPASGAIIIDAPATDARVQAWIAFRYDIGVYFYWHANHWEHNRQKRGERVQDIWRNPITFDNRGEPGKSGGFANGDGVLVYPGQDRPHPQQDRGVAGPIASIQLANLRRGVQDHLYLTLARRLGLHALVDQALYAIVPHALGEARGDKTVPFPEQGDAFEAQRRLLAAAIARASHSP